MIARTLWPILFVAGVAHAAALPLRPGAFVQAGVPCADPPLATVFDFDGQHFSYPHASRCRSEILARRGKSYRVRETCTALGDGSPAAPSTTVTTYRISSSERLELRQGKSPKAIAYRWCGKKAS